MTLHIVQGGISNGDLEWLLTAQGRAITEPWIVPKHAELGDTVVIYITGRGFVATASVMTPAEPRRDWRNRYGAAVGQVRLIEPPISLESIRHQLPDLTWARYPRSIHTPDFATAATISQLIARHQNVPESLIVSNQAATDIATAQEQLQAVDATTREALVQARLGQGSFRAKLLAYWGGCAVTGCTVGAALTASHIKPWRDSTNAERLDSYNGLMLLGTLDLLFDAGLISFARDGKLLRSPRLSRKQQDVLGLGPQSALRRINSRHRLYLEWHHQFVFAKTA